MHYSFMVGFREPDRVKQVKPYGLRALPLFDLVKVSRSSRWWEPDGNGEILLAGNIRRDVVYGNPFNSLEVMPIMANVKLAGSFR